MSRADRSVKNTAKNIFLLLEIALLVLLCAANWLTGLDFDQIPANSLIRRAHDKLHGGAVGYELRSSGVSAAEPSQLALTVDGQLYGVQYSLSEIDTGMEAVRTLWAEALSSAKLENAAEADLAAALLSGDCALLRYHGGIPLSIAAGWMGGVSQSELAAETLIYAAGTGQLFVRTDTGELYAGAVSVSSSTLQEAQQNFRGLACSFAGTEYAVRPETLLFERETLSLPRLTAEPLDLFGLENGTGLEDLLDCFGFTAYSNYYSELEDTVRVFVDDVSTLRINASGLIQYAAGADGAVRAYEDGEASGRAALDAQIDCARTILDTAVRTGETETHASLYAVQQSETRTTLIFLQMFSGVPVLEENDFATFVFEDGSLSSATIRLEHFKAEETRCTVLPARQAAAAGTAEGSSGLIVAYRRDDSGYVPDRFLI